jgi:hypothetical protein
MSIAVLAAGQTSIDVAQRTDARGTTSTTLAQNIAYSHWGALISFQNGCVGRGCVQLQETYAYKNRLQPVMIELGTSGSNAADYRLM